MSNSEKVVRGAFGSLRIRQFAVVVLGVIDGLVLLGITYSMQKIIDALILGKEGNVDTYLYLFFRTARGVGAVDVFFAVSFAFVEFYGGFRNPTQAVR